MRFRATILALVAALAVAATALAAPAIKDPMSLLLRKSDMPRGATWVSGPGPRNLVNALRTLGIPAKDAYFASSYGDGLNLSGLVLTVESSGQARTVFRQMKGELTSDPGPRPIRLPAYGDEQYATTSSGSADLLVRKNTVIWSLSVTFEITSPKSTARTRAELQKYAPKQKLRVGRG